jgi:hypothetical protein
MVAVTLVDAAMSVAGVMSGAAMPDAATPDTVTLAAECTVAARYAGAAASTVVAAATRAVGTAAADTDNPLAASAPKERSKQAV